MQTTFRSNLKAGRCARWVAGSVFAIGLSMSPAWAAPMDAADAPEAVAAQAEAQALAMLQDKLARLSGAGPRGLPAAVAGAPQGAPRRATVISSSVESRDPTVMRMPNAAVDSADGDSLTF